MPVLIEVSKDEAVKALRRSAFMTDDGPVIHRMGSFTGADCSLNGCIEDINRASRVAWVEHFADHDLGIELDGRCWFYGVKREVTA